MTEPRWDDDRLGEAFTARFGGAAPADLAPATIAALARSDARRRQRGWIWSASVAAALLVAVSLGTQLIGEGDVPATATARGLPVRTIADALSIRQTGSDEPIAVRGYLSPPPQLRCPFPVSTALNPVRLDCPRNFSWLLDSADPLPTVTARLPEGRTGFHPVFPGIDVSALEADDGEAGRRLVELVVIGHFNDRRAIPSLCDAPSPSACDSFVVDAIDSVEGVPQPPSTVLDLEPYEGEPRRDPAWTPDEATTRAKAIAPSLDVLSQIALPGHRIAELEPALGTGQLGIIDRPVVWLVNGLERQSDGGTRLRTLLLVDSDTAVYESTLSAGFVPVAPTTASESPTPSMASATDVFPAEILGLPAIAVSEALARRDAGPDDTALAVRGYFSRPNVGVDISCPATPAKISPVQSRCPDAVTWLTEGPEQLWSLGDAGWQVREPDGPGLNPIVRFDVPFEMPAHRNNGRPAPLPVVVLGHFADRRAAACPGASIEACRRAFVVDALLWADGRPTPLAPVDVASEPIEPGAAEAVERRFRVATGLVAEPVWLALVEGSNVREIEPWAAEQAPQLTGAEAVWVVRALVRLDDGRPVIRTGYALDGGSQVWIGIDDVVAPWGRRL